MANVDWLALPWNCRLTAAGCHCPRPSSCCAALQIWLGLFPMQTVMLAIVCVSCLLLSPQVDVEARTLQVGDHEKACICSSTPWRSLSILGVCLLYRAIVKKSTQSCC